ncbi:hypothetical protein D3C81_1960430 [compost metagenome]
MAVGFNTAGFPHQPGVENLQPQPFGYPRGDLTVCPMGLLVAPTVEVELRDGETTLAIHDKGGTGITAPQIIGRNVP